MDEFLIILAFSLVLLGGMVLLFNVQLAPAPGQPGTNVSTVASVTVGPVGFVPSVPSKIVEIKPFGSGTTQSDLIKSWSSQDIVTGLFDNKELADTIALNKNVLDVTTRVLVEFDVNQAKTAPEQDLVILWNGNEMFRGKPSGHQTVSIRGNITESNSMRVFTTSPGVSSIVKSTAYGLENIRVSQEYGQARIETLELDAKDLEVFDRAEINFATIQRGSGGNLSVKVNGIQLYNQNPDRFVLLNFDQKNVPNLGTTNRVSFSSDGLFDITNAKINVYLLSTTVVKKKSFILAADQLAKLDKKTLTLQVTAALKKPGKLSVKVNGNQYDFFALEDGLNTKTILKGDLTEGENTIEFSATGAFDIPEAKIVAQ